MININELRIGNLVSTSFKDDVLWIMGVRTQKVKNDYFELVFLSDEISYLPTHIEPIPISKEYLDKFGFTYIFDNIYCNSTEKVHFDIRKVIFDETDITNNGWYLCIDEEIHYQKIKFIHQLQNIYFLLTGTELSIKQIEKQP